MPVESRREGKCEEASIIKEKKATIAANKAKRTHQKLKGLAQLFLVMGRIVQFVLAQGETHVRHALLDVIGLQHGKEVARLGM